MAGEVYVTFGGDSSALEASLASAKAAVSAMTRELTSLAREQVKTGSGAESDLGQKMLAIARELDEAREAVERNKDALKEHGEGSAEVKERIDEVTESFKHLAEIVGLELGVEAFKEWVSETSEAAEKIEQESAKLGVSIEQIEKLQGVAKLAGTDYDDLARQFERLQLSLAKVGDKASPASEALRVLGLSAAQLRGQSADKQLETIAEAFARFGDGPAKTAAALALLGRAGAEMIPFLDKGREGLEELGAVSQRTGIILSGEMIEAMARTREDLNEMSLAWTAASREIFAAFNPAIDAAAQEINRFLEGLTVNKIREWTLDGIAAFRLFSEGGIDAFERLRADIVLAEAYFENLGTVVSSIASTVVGPIEAIAAAVRDVRDALDELHNHAAAMDSGAVAGARLGGMLGRGAPGGGGAASPFGDLGGVGEFGEASLGDLNRKLQFEAALSGQRLKAGLDDYTKSLTELFAKSKEDVKRAEGGAKPQVPGMNLDRGAGAKAAGEDARETFNQQVEAAREAAQQIEDTLSGELQRHQISMDEWVAQSKVALQDEATAIRAAAAEALASAALTSEQKKRIALDEQKDLARIAHQEAEDQNKAALEAQKDWQTAAGQIEADWNSQLRSVLGGTESFGEAMKKVLADVVIQGIEWFEKLALNYVLQETVMNNAATAGAALRTAANMAGASGGIGALLSRALAAVTVSAGQTGAEVAAYMAPVIGPAAVGVGEAAQASVLSMGVASADIGMWQVPADQLALIHHNELVMPAGQAAAFRDLLSGGKAGGANVSLAPETHFHVSAVDASGVEGFFRDNQKEMMRSVSRAVREGAHLGLRRLGVA